ncbi:MAG: hypothetical protein C0498_06180 [Anaerolinea sp.]|nr:hypothetical protein [Anaerolinea sp.]
MDDLPIFEEAPLREVDFAPRAVGPSSRRGPLIASAWAIGLVALAGVGALAGGAGEPGTARGLPPAGAAEPDVAQPATSPSSPQAHQSPGHGTAVVTDVVDLASPAPARVEITTRRVAVLGSVLVRAARVEIFLEARGNRVLDHVSIDVTDPDGGVRPERAPTFSASFDLPYPRPNGTMWIVVTVYDERGMPLGGTRRPFSVGPLLEEGAD